MARKITPEDLIDAEIERLRNSDAVKLAQWLNRSGRQPEQVQDFYPTPGTVSTCMFYTGLDPYTMEKVYVPRSPREKAQQRALLQYFRPENRELVLDALKRAGRLDLIGTGKHCLARPEAKPKTAAPNSNARKPARSANDRKNAPSDKRRMGGQMQPKKKRK